MYRFRPRAWVWAVDFTIVEQAQTRVTGWKDLCAVMGLEPSQWRKAHRAALRGELPIFYDRFGKPTAVVGELKAALNVVTPASEHRERKAHATATRRAQAA